MSDKLKEELARVRREAAEACRADNERANALAAALRPLVSELFTPTVQAEKCPEALYGPYYLRAGDIHRAAKAIGGAA